jgi:hypothetical protein
VLRWVLGALMSWRPLAGAVEQRVAALGTGGASWEDLRNTRQPRVSFTASPQRRAGAFSHFPASLDCAALTLDSDSSSERLGL